MLIIASPPIIHGKQRVLLTECYDTDKWLYLQIPERCNDSSISEL